MVVKSREQFKRLERRAFIHLVLLLMAVPVAGRAQSGQGYGYTVNPDNTNTITITSYFGSGGAVSIPTAISNLTVTVIGENAFYDNYSVSSVVIPGSVTSIADTAFKYCMNLTSVSIPNSVASIGENAFLYCPKLTSFTIPASVTNLGDGVLGECESLRTITVSAQSLYFSTTNGVLFNKSQTALLAYPASLPAESYAVPNGVTSIGGYAFSLCLNLTNVMIPKSVTSIGDSAFESCVYISSVALSDSITNIGDNAFEDSGITSVVVPSSLTSIGATVFCYCINLTNATIPASVTNFGYGAFLESYNLVSLFFAGNAPVADSSVFSLVSTETVYYLPGTTGWDDFATNTGAPVVLWNPLIQVGDTDFGMQNNHFGFDITGTTNIPIVIEACTNLASPAWTAQQSLVLSNGLFHFSDPAGTNYPGRYYRIRSP